MNVGRWLVRTLLIIVAAGLSACAKPPPAPPPPPPPPPPTIVDATYDAQPNVNPDGRGRASPVVVRIYELKSIAGFNSADFFSLYERDKEALGEDLVARDEVQLLPGNTSHVQRQLKPDTRFIGVVAAFRDLEHAQWRATIPIPLNKTTKLEIRLAQNQINLVAH